MYENKTIVVFCNPHDARILLEDDKDISSALVISELIPPGEVVVVPEDEFLDWLYEGDDLK